jgi:uncharacterized protein
MSIIKKILLLISLCLFTLLSLIKFLGLNYGITVIVFEAIQFSIMMFFLLRKDYRMFLPVFYVFLTTTFLLIVHLFNLTYIGDIYLVFNVFILLFYYVLIFRIEPLRKEADYIKKGKLDGLSIFLVVATVIVSSVALILWFKLLNPDISDLEELLPTKNILLIILLGIAFSLFNAVTEELVWRGIVWDGLNTICKAPAFVIIVQSIGFGLIHISGFPRGWIGVGLACIYGLFLGFIRYRTKGLLYPIIAHIFTDGVIFAVVVYQVLSK